jgi:hypothetical protein
MIGAAMALSGAVSSTAGMGQASVQERLARELSAGLLPAELG